MLRSLIELNETVATVSMLDWDVCRSPSSWVLQVVLVTVFGLAGLSLLITTAANCELLCLVCDKAYCTLGPKPCFLAWSPKVY